MAELTDIREAVRERYASAAKAAADGAGCCTPADATGVFGAALSPERPRASFTAATEACWG